MFLRHVRLTHWACHDAIELTPGPGLNVVIGPNGVGKSTLCGAIIAALTIKHSSKDRDVRLLEPWGTEGCGPSVSLDLSRPDGGHRVSKTFLHDASARLDRFEDGRWALRHKGRAAEEELARWLDSDGAAGRLLLELWSPQADPTRLFDAASRGGRLAPASLLGAGMADRVASAEATGPFAMSRRIVAEHVARSFTPVNRQVKVGSDLYHAEAALRDAEARWHDLSQRRDDLARRVEEYRDLESAFGLDCAERDRLDGLAEQRQCSRAAYQERLESLRSAEDEARRRRETFDRFDRDHRRLIAASAELAAAEARLAALEPRIRDHRSLTERARQALQDAEKRRSTVASLLDELAIALDRLNRIDDAARSHQDRLVAERMADRRCSEAEAARLAAEAAVASSRAALHHAESDRELARRRSLALAVRQAAAAALAARDRLRLADRDRLRSDRDRLDRTIRQSRERLHERSTLDPSADGGPVPSAEEIQALRNRSAELDARLDALDADAITLRVEADRPLTARIAADGQGGDAPSSISAGEAIEARAVGRLTLEIEGVGRVLIGRSSEAFDHRRRQVESDRRDLADRLAALGAATIADLEHRRRRSDRRAALDTELDALLGGESIESLQARLDEWDATLRSFDDLPTISEVDQPPAPIEQLRLHAEAAERTLAIARDRLDAAGGDINPAIPIDPEEAGRRVDASRSSLSQAEDRLAAAPAEAEAARSRLAQERARLADAEKALADEERGDSTLPDRLRIEIAALRQRLVVYDADPPGETGQAVRLRLKAIEDDLDARRLRRDEAATAMAALDRESATAEAGRDAARRRLDDLRSEAADDRPPEDREHRLDELRRDRDRAEALANVLRDQLGADPSADDDDFQARRSEVVERCRRAEQELAVRLRELELLGAEGLDTRLALAAEQLDDRRARFDAIDRDALAWRLLDRVLGEVEADFARNIARQVEDLSRRWVDRLTGRNVSAVTLDPESLSPVSAHPGASELARALDHFSRGTREQVALACRLQLGVLLAQDARQMILLDDPLAHTDPGRHAEALDVLAEVARSLQVLIFTCHRDRYARLWERGDAHCLELAPRDGSAERPAVALGA